MKNTLLDIFILESWVEIEADNLSALEEFKKNLIHMAVCYCSSNVAVERRDFSIALIKALSKIFSSSNVEYFMIKNPEIHSRNIWSVDRELAKRSSAPLMQDFSLVLMLLLRVELQHTALFVCLRDNVLNKRKLITK